MLTITEPGAQQLTVRLSTRLTSMPENPTPLALTCATRSAARSARHPPPASIKAGGIRLTSSPPGRRCLYRSQGHSQLRPFGTVLILTIVAGLSLSLAGCGKTAASTPDTIVIVPSATANEPDPVLSAANRGLLETAGSASTQAQAYVVNPATGQPANIPLTPRRPDGQVEYGPRRQFLLEANVTRVAHLLSGEAATGPFDLLNMIAAAARVTSPPGTLLILSSGLSTAGGIDLRQVGWGAGPGTVAAQLNSGACCRTCPAGRSSSPGSATPPDASRRCRYRSAPLSPPTGWLSAGPLGRLPARPTRPPAPTRLPQHHPGSGGTGPSGDLGPGTARQQRRERPRRRAVRLWQRRPAPGGGQPSCSRPSTRRVLGSGWCRSPATPHRTAVQPPTTSRCPGPVLRPCAPA